MRRNSGSAGDRGWVRVVAMLAVLAMVASVGYSALVSAQAPTWMVLVLAAVVIGLPIALLARRDDPS